MTENRIHVDIDNPPVLLITMLGQTSDEDYMRYLGKTTLALGSGKYRVAIVDARLSDMNSPRFSRMQADWLRKNKTSLDALGFATVLVIDKPVLRFALSALLALSPIPGTHKVVASLSDAAAWTIPRLRSGGHRVPAALFAYAA